MTIQIGDKVKFSKFPSSWKVDHDTRGVVTGTTGYRSGVYEVTIPGQTGLYFRTEAQLTPTQAAGGTMASTASQHRVLKKGDSVKLNPRSGWSRDENVRHANNGTVATVTSTSDGADFHTIEFPDGYVIHGLGRNALLWVEASIREQTLASIRADRKKVEDAMMKATEEVKKNQKIIEDSVPLLEQYDGVISDLS